MSGFRRLIRLLNPRVRKKLKHVRYARAYASGFVPSANGKYPTAEELKERKDHWLKVGEDWYVQYSQRARLMKKTERREQTLVIVDPQTGFINDDQSALGHLEARKLLKELILQIRLAKKLSWSIIVLTYAGYGDVHPKIMAALSDEDGEKRCYFGVKKDRSGAQQIKKLCTEHSLQSHRLRLVGGHTNQCLQATVSGLIGLLPESQFEIVTRACWPKEFGYWIPYINTKSVLLLPAPIIMPSPFPSREWWNLRALKSGVT